MKYVSISSYPSIYSSIYPSTDPSIHLYICQFYTSCLWFNNWFVFSSSNIFFLHSPCFDELFHVTQYEGVVCSRLLPSPDCTLLVSEGGVRPILGWGTILVHVESLVAGCWSQWFISLVMDSHEAKLCPAFACGFLGDYIYQHLYPVFCVPICHPFPSFVIKCIH